MTPQRGAAEAAWGWGERGRRVTRYWDWNIRDRGGPSHWASPGAEQVPGERTRARQRVDGPAGPPAGGG